MRLIVIITCFIGFQSLLAQNDSTKSQGEIISGEVVIEKDNEIILPQADKIYLRTTPKSFGSQPVDITFLKNEPAFEWPKYKSDVPFQVLNEKYPNEEYQNYVLAGFGNYSSPLIEAGLFKTFGAFESSAKIYYESFKAGPINDENSGSAVGGIDLSGTYKKEGLSLTPTIKYKNSRYSYYGNANRVNSGFDANATDDVTLSEILLNVDLAGGKEDIKYIIRPTISNVNQSQEGVSGISQETGFELHGTLNYKIDDAFTTGFDMQGNSATYKSGIQVNRSLININPWLTHTRDNLSITAGFMISSGSVESSSKTGFYPKARVDYNLTEKWTIYGLVSGGQEWNSLSALINENQFLDDSLTIVNSEYTAQFGGGFKGTPVKNLLLDASLTYSSVKGMPFYVPSSSDSSRYILTYDTESVGVVTLNSSISYMPSATSTYGVSLEINGYSMESLDRPWHKPAYIFEAYTSHNIQEKLIVSAFLTSMGGIRGPANVDFGYVKLSAFTDLGVGAKYLVTQRASAFIRVNNLLNSEYERYLGYPTRGITFKIGGQYRF
ncbi:hypothetical protein [Ekhidna sp. To15]|uniref:hypothetical protein n=1 Tax=Ekhidna sp. To15 TaxID=3395267 RepID=UPI003F51B046